mmetsp:Transcript_2968/g.10843  ORF Transcript_2968/g.10843 Transcript_2968/m.10843 type:complete len:321 (+) Transcript_2968:229-1191(+)
MSATREGTLPIETPSITRSAAVKLASAFPSRSSAAKCSATVVGTPRETSHVSTARGPQLWSDAGESALVGVLFDAEAAERSGTVAGLPVAEVVIAAWVRRSSVRSRCPELWSDSDESVLDEVLGAGDDELASGTVAGVPVASLSRAARARRSSVRSRCWSPSTGLESKVGSCAMSSSTAPLTCCAANVDRHAPSPSPRSSFSTSDSSYSRSGLALHEAAHSRSAARADAAARAAPSANRSSARARASSPRPPRTGGSPTRLLTARSITPSSLHRSASKPFSLPSRKFSVASSSPPEMSGVTRSIVGKLPLFASNLDDQLK